MFRMYADFEDLAEATFEFEGMIYRLCGSESTVRVERERDLVLKDKVLDILPLTVVKERGQCGPLPLFESP